MPYLNQPIVIVDDDPFTVGLLERRLRKAQFNQVFGARNAREALALCAEQWPALVILDLRLPDEGGLEVLRKLREKEPSRNLLPILVVSGDVSVETRRQVLEAGASDFQAKRFDSQELALRVKALLVTRELFLELQRETAQLEDRVRQRTTEVVRTQIEVIDLLGAAVDFRDGTTGHHTKRVGDLSASIGEALGLPKTDLSLLRRAAPLHDVGKIAMPDHILLKPGPLTPDEFTIMKTHATIGAQLLSESSAPLLRTAAQIAWTHHENWDGTGYPRGLFADEIPVFGRIVAVADVFDALVTERPYKKAWIRRQAVRQIDEQKGRKFDPQVVDAFLGVIHGETEPG